MASARRVEGGGARAQRRRGCPMQEEKGEAAALGRKRGCEGDEGGGEREEGDGSLALGSTGAWSRRGDRAQGRKIEREMGIARIGRSPSWQRACAWRRAGNERERDRWRESGPRVRGVRWALGGRPSGERSGQRPSWAAGLGSLSLTNLYQKRNRERKRKRGLGKDLRMGIIFPDSQK